MCSVPSDTIAPFAAIFRHPNANVETQPTRRALGVDANRSKMFKVEDRKEGGVDSNILGNKGRL